VDAGLSWRGALALVLVLACAHGSDARDGYAGWHSVTTEHFVLYTPLAASDAEETASQLELLYQGLSRAVFPRSNLDRIEVLLFQDPEDSARAVADATAAAGDGARQRGALVLSLHDRGRAQTAGTGVERFTTSWQMTAARTMAHRFLESAMDRPPQWLRVGLSRYLATAQIEPDAAIFGRRPDDLAGELRQGRAIPLGELLAAGPTEFGGGWSRDHEATAWGFIHYLLDGEGGKLRPRFDAIMAALRGDHADSRTAVEQAFPDIPFSALEGKVRDYLVESLGRRSTFHPFPVSLTPPPATRGTAAAADPGRVHALLLGLGRGR
jgi:hypothetical protein